MRSLICVVNHALQSNQTLFSVVDKYDCHFCPELKTLDSSSSELHHSGVAVAKSSAKLIEVQHENLFLGKGLLGISMAKVLQCTIFFYVELNFVFWGIQDWYDLVPSQFLCCPQDTTI